MYNLGISNQTLDEFLKQPFGIPNNQKYLEYEKRYQEYKRNNKIRVEASLEYENNYFIHIKVPSESHKGEIYHDVVIQFFLPDSKFNSHLSIEKYYVQFFSNSPGFVYKYATLYKMQGYLIESLYNKFNQEMIDVLPEKANKKFDLYYDSSIYYASRFLLDHKMLYFGKLNIKIFKRKSVDSFFRDIKSVEESNSISSIKTSLKKEIQEDTKLSNSQELKLKRNKKISKQISDKKQGKHDTLKSFKPSKVIKGNKKVTSKMKKSPTKRTGR